MEVPLTIIYLKLWPMVQMHVATPKLHTQVNVHRCLTPLIIVLNIYCLTLGTRVDAKKKKLYHHMHYNNRLSRSGCIPV